MSNFKIEGPEYESRKEDMRSLIDVLGTEKILASYKDNPSATLNGLYQKIWFDRKNKDSHPAFLSGQLERILPYQEGYEIYPNDSNDDHLRTMLKRAMYEILPESKAVDRGRASSHSPGNF